MPTNTIYDPGYPFHPTSHYGTERKRGDGAKYNHSGVDYGAPEGTDIPAAAGGVIVFSARNATYGYTVIVEHTNHFGNKVYTLYAHLKENSKLPYGAKVNAGTKIGEVGNTGTSEGFHLHFEVLQPDGYDSDGPYFGKERKRLNTGKDASQIGFLGSVGRTNPETYRNYNGEVFSKGAPGYRSSWRDEPHSFAREAENARRASATDNHHSTSRHYGGHAENGTLVRHGGEVTRIEPDGSTRGSFHSD
ncbi:MAG: M23 family metallopeptidase [Nitrospinae bacterium]|nr:M23 family metallopeptidase [Nitrospinota bacterium]